MKRLLVLVLGMTLALSVTACGNSGGPGSASSGEAESQGQESTEAEEAVQDSDMQEASGQESEGEEEQGSASEENGSGENADAGSGSSILIAYFSAAENSGVDAVASASYSMVNGEAVGRLSAIANMIRSEVGGDLFSIRTSVVYPADGGELIDYAAQEQDEDARPELTSHIENLDGYDVVFVGYAGGIIGLNQEKPINQGFALV